MRSFPRPEGSGTRGNRPAVPEWREEADVTKAFRARLAKLGMRSYREYLASEFWRSAKERYERSELPKRCIACDHEAYVLHHRSYARIGEEQPGDLIPLCRDCHARVHDYERSMGTKVQHAHKMLRDIFGWSREETERRFRPFGGLEWIGKNWDKALTPRQAIRELRRQDPANPAFWTAKQRARAAR